ncbi:hypothetical protein M0765_016695 [Variovorax sp. S2]|uniref:hypothetical protein n=1 Tax=Variovorax sp. S12S4 TaxID=3029170 RepID=UPI00215CFE74|nr:hypothetical protein [Variovorax sp. S12S4]MCR8959311.1 hypothetical protein [Variovorax sp. S12S4]
MSASIQNRCVHCGLARNWATQLFRARVTRLSPWWNSTWSRIPARSASMAKFIIETT